MRVVIVVLALSGALVAEGSSLAWARSAQESPEEQAQVHSARGTVHFNLGRFEEAIAEYRKGYEVLALPEFLFNIGQCYQQLGSFERALFFYRRFLSTRPDAPNRADVEARIAKLEEVVPAEAQLRSGEAHEPLPTVPPVDPSADLASRAPPAPPEAPPLWRRPWVWAAAGALVLGAAATFYLVRAGDDSVPRSQLGNGRFF